MWYIVGGVILGVLLILVLGYWLGMRKVVRNTRAEFWNFAVKAIERRYKGNLPQGKIVFYGSSSIQFWKTLEADMAPLPVLRHGIAGIKIGDATHFFDRLVTPFHPKRIVLFAGTNDLSGVKGATRTGEEVYRDTVTFFEKAARELPGTPIYYIAITPAPGKTKARGEVDTANRLIREYIEENAGKALHFIDCEKGILDEYGQPRKELFRSDKIHFNGKGYEVWTKYIKPTLLNN